MKSFLSIVFLLTFTMACSTLKSSPEIKEGSTIYSYSDVSGQYRLKREVKIIKKKLVTRSQILLPTNKVVESSIMVAQLGTIKNGKQRTFIARPMASEFTVWLEGKKYSSKMKLDTKTKSMKLTLNSPEKKWNGTSQIPVPKSKYFCFYSQLSDCLFALNMLEKARSQKGQTLSFVLVWDSYPYVQELLSGVGANLFTQASIRFDGEEKKRLRYIIEVDGQELIYQFAKNFSLVRVAWISQGITIVPPGEETQE